MAAADLAGARPGCARLWPSATPAVSSAARRAAASPGGRVARRCGPRQPRRPPGRLRVRRRPARVRDVPQRRSHRAGRPQSLRGPGDDGVDDHQPRERRAGRRPTSGVAFLPAAPAPHGVGEAVVLGELRQLDLSRALSARAAVPRAVRRSAQRPAPYAYALPYPYGQTFSVLQGFHGAFSHKGSNEYAVDFDCPVATPRARGAPGDGVVASNASAQGSGTTADYLDYKRTNFVIVLHDDGTLGEYMHLAPSERRGQARPARRAATELALSGNTGFSSTPHLHFQVMTAGDDGIPRPRSRSSWRSTPSASRSRSRAAATPPGSSAAHNASCDNFIQDGTSGLPRGVCAAGCGIGRGRIQIRAAARAIATG